MRKNHILVAEDDPAIAESIREYLERAGEFEVGIVAAGYDALRCLSASLPDALLIEAALPDVSGPEICRVVRARERTARLPLIMLGDRYRGVGLIGGLEVGADDFVVKPLDLKELEARLKAVLRRHAQLQSPQEEAFSGAHIDANFADVRITVDGRHVSLTRREFRVLRFLVHNRNQVLGREHLLATIWGPSVRDRRVVDSAMWKLRTKLTTAGGQIETITGLGYRFNEPPQTAMKPRSVP